MKTFSISFWIDGEEQIEVFTLYEMASNPFKVGDIISLNVDWLVPKDYQPFSPERQQVVKAKNEWQTNTFNHKKLRLITEGKYVRFNDFMQDHLNIEYFCQLLDREGKVITVTPFNSGIE